MGENIKLNDISFDTENIQSLWTNLEYYICIYKMKDNKEIVIENANTTYLNLFQITENDFEKEISLLLSTQTVRTVSDLFDIQLVNEANNDLEYMREVDELHGSTFWNVSSRIINGCLYCIGKKIHEFFVTPSKSPLDLGYPSIIVSLTKDKRYKIESFSEEIYPSLESLCLEEGYIEISHANSYFFKSTKILDECIRTNKTIQFMDIVKLPDSSKSVLVTMIPMLHYDASRILIIIKRSMRHYSISSIENLEKFSREFGEYYHSNLLGMCFLEQGDDKSFKVVVSNSCFQNIMEQGDITEEFLIKSDLFKQCLQTHIVVRGYIRTKSSREACAQYFVHIIPTVNENKVVRIFLVIDAEYQRSKQANDLILKLTKREREILSYVADGYTNKYISSQLNIAEGTVKRIVSNGYKKLDISSRIELAKVFLSDD